MASTKSQTSWVEMLTPARDANQLPPASLYELRRGQPASALRVTAGKHAAAPQPLTSTLTSPKPYGRFSCHDTPNRSASQPKRRLKP